VKVNKTSARHTWTLIAVVASFAAGVLVDSWLRTYGPPKPTIVLAEPVIGAPPPPAIRSAPAATVWKVTPPAVAATGDLPRPRLRVPIDGTSVESFEGGFAERRGGSRPHEAVDILSPRNTPVHAVDTGTITKLFVSNAGGITIYQFDPTGRLCYYYAHLERYAHGLHEGQAVSQGDVIGYVGTSGNAPSGTPHLHFAVFELSAGQHWWQGRPLDPYLVFKDKG
jgi:murein DD-endopeptidase MepM/ murein hydrolase activator NlpD